MKTGKQYTKKYRPYTVCFHAEKNVHLGDESDERFAEILGGAYRTEEAENCGMDVLRIY